MGTDSKLINKQHTVAIYCDRYYNLRNDYSMEKIVNWFEVEENGMSAKEWITLAEELIALDWEGGGYCGHEPGKDMLKEIVEELKRQPPDDRFTLYADSQDMYHDWEETKNSKP